MSLPFCGRAVWAVMISGLADALRATPDRAAVSILSPRNPVCVVPDGRREFNCCAVEPVEYRVAAVCPRHRESLVVIITGRVAGRHVVSRSLPGEFLADAESRPGCRPRLHQFV